MDRDASRFACSHEAWHQSVGVVGRRANDLAVIVCRNAAHVVMHRRQHRDGFAGHINACKHLGAFGNAWQPFANDVRVEVVKVQIDVVFVGAHAATFANLHCHRSAHHIAGGQILGVRGVALHEPLAL